MKPLISIIVPVYNVERYLRRCLESLIRQNYDEIEIIVVDDGSTDKSGEICDDFAEKDKRVRVFHKKNGGLSDARNFGIKKAKGEIIAFVDSDDYVSECFVGDLYEMMVGDDADVVTCGYDSVKPKRETISGEDATIRLLTELENIDILAWNKLYKKNLFVMNDIWFPKNKKHEDLLTIYKILSMARRVSYLDESLYCYTERKGSITNEEKIEERLEARESAAREAIGFFRDNRKLKKASEISLLLAKYAYLDFSISGRIDKENGRQARRWIVDHRSEFAGNIYLTRKLKIYNIMSTKFGGVFYWIFRKIKHE